jgi:Arc/MetJ-type ribon-helix-helix transcriptional regulator
MVRTQIQLTEQQSQKVHEAARRSGISVAEVIRRGLDLYLEQESGRTAGVATRQAAGQIAGLFHSGRSDVAERHDEYLDEAYAG